MSAEPFEHEVFDEETKKQMHGYTQKYMNTFVRIGEKKWICPKVYLEQSEKFRKFKTRPSDVWVLSQARAGTTWTQEMAWLVANNLDYENALKYLLDSRFPFIDIGLLAGTHPPYEEFYKMSEKEEEKVKLATKEGKSSPEIIAAYPSPRFIKSHLAFDLLPEDLFDSGCKIIYVARNPKDVAVSLYHFQKNVQLGYGSANDFKTFWNLFKNNLIMFTPYWEHVKQAWKRRNHQNFLFLFYEDMHSDLPKVIEKVVKFLGKRYTSQEIAKLADHLNVKNFKKNKAINKTVGAEATMFKTNTFIRNGQVGRWREEFTPELEAEADEWIQENLKDTDLKFPIQL